MMIRVLRLRGGPLLGAALLVVALLVLLAVVSFGLLLLAGLTLVGGVAFVARRLFGPRVRSPAVPEPPHGMQSEVFAPDERSRNAALPPGPE